ncbi:hypothetical protein ABLG96_14610 [Nakamurella sp. A5-74]|uniref:Uncharacterized protein n=1 Tax=Nakamurella sp. A5-74 TaxID=3158264 RepID=A0AAU8DJT6_9ACTN
MTVQPVSHPPAPGSALPSAFGRPDPATSRWAGVTTVLIGALLLQFARVFQIGNASVQSNWDSRLAIIIPALALPAALVWWTRSPAVAQRLLPVVVGIALVPGAALSLLPALVGVTPDVVVTALVMVSSAAMWTTSALVLICAASLARSGRILAASLACSVLVLANLLLPTVFGSIVARGPATWIFAVLVLVAAVVLVIGGLSVIRSAEGPVLAAVALTTVLGALAMVVPSVLTYFLSTSGGPRPALGGTAAIGAVLVVVTIAGALLLGRAALLLVLGAGLLLGCLYGLTSSVGAGLGRDWWLPLLVVLVLALAAGLSMTRPAREVGMSAIALVVIVLAATFGVVEFGHLDEGLEIFLTVAGLIGGAVAGGAIIGAVVPRLVRSDDLVPVLLLTLALGAGASRLFAWVFVSTETDRNHSLLWIGGVLLVSLLFTALWPRSGRVGDAPRPGPDAEVDPGVGVR